MKKFAAIALLNLCGAALLGSFLLPEGQEIWRRLDSAIFLFSNQHLRPGSLFLYLTAIGNVRAFDLVSVFFMGGLYYMYFRRADAEGKRRMIAIGLVMLATAVVVKQCSGLYPISHPSPTRFSWPVDINRVSQLTDFGAKDSDGNSFPGDHGMMLMIFAAFMARYHGRKALAAASLIVLIFAMPRIMSGAHWFSDVYMGSLSVVLLVCPWLLLTPASDRLADLFQRLLPRRLFRKNSP